MLSRILKTHLISTKTETEKEKKRKTDLVPLLKSLVHIVKCITQPNFIQNLLLLIFGNWLTQLGYNCLYYESCKKLGQRINCILTYLLTLNCIRGVP